MDEAAPAAGAAAEKKRRLLRRVPTSLLVTLLGIALTAWLLPAFTHQWDDRQKAQELKTAIVSDMASASAKALTGGEPIWSRAVAMKEGDSKVLANWSLSSLRIETRLRAYFSPEIVTAWQIYTWLVNRWNNAHLGEAEAALRAATYALGDGPTSFQIGRPVHLDDRMANAIALVFVVGDGQIRGSVAPRFDAGNFYVEPRLLSRLRPHFDRYVKAYPHFTWGWPAAEWALVHLQAVMVEEILHAHVAGYSTTTHDLLHDLIPGT